jgi:putative endonuclease
MYKVYIIYSKNLDKYYVGQTIDVERRIKEHNTGFYKSAYTSKTNDWVLYFFIECTSKSQGIKLEAHIKRMKSRKYYEDIKRYPEISEKLLLKYTD